MLYTLVGATLCSCAVGWGSLRKCNNKATVWFQIARISWNSTKRFGPAVSGCWVPRYFPTHVCYIWRSHWQSSGMFPYYTGSGAHRIFLIYTHYIFLQIGELAGIAVGATILVDVLFAGYITYRWSSIISLCQCEEIWHFSVLYLTDRFRGHPWIRRGA